MRHQHYRGHSAAKFQDLYMKKYRLLTGCTKRRRKTAHPPARSPGRLGFTRSAGLRIGVLRRHRIPSSATKLAPPNSSVESTRRAGKRAAESSSPSAHCHNQTNDLMINDPSTEGKQLSRSHGAYGGGTKGHALSRGPAWRDHADAVARRRHRASHGKKIAAYYGCLLLRPGKVMPDGLIRIP